jgi:membrane-bound lytic murein transglycosylase B
MAEDKKNWSWDEIKGWIKKKAEEVSKGAAKKSDTSIKPKGGGTSNPQEIQQLKDVEAKVGMPKPRVVASAGDKSRWGRGMG